MIFPVGYEAVKAAWQRACARAEVAAVHIHDLRHTAATRFTLDLNGNLPVLKIITGHKTYSQLNRYINVKPDDVEACRHPAYALGPRPDLQDRVRALVEEYNLQNNTPPLSTRECRQIAKSIANYVLSGRRQLLIGRTWLYSAGETRMSQWRGSAQPDARSACPGRCVLPRR